MKIQIDGTGMQNKGAELMLYAILGEIEKRFPDSTVIYNTGQGDINQIDTTLNIEQRFPLKYGRYPSGISRRLNLNLPIFESYYPVSNIDFVLDGSGFKWGDQWKYNDRFYEQLTKYYKGLKEKGTKIILLPQAFGPFDTTNGKKIIGILNKFVDLIFAREKISYNYLIEAGIDRRKTSICSDFSLTVKGKYPSNLNTAGGVCFIPNRQMIKHSKISKNQYIDFLRKLILKTESLGSKPFLLNHEGKGDLDICVEVDHDLENPIQVITGLNAKQTKGVISKSYAVISSRFHGVASSLNQSVPCLATSWSHKYKELFDDFGLSESILDIHGSEQILDAKIELLLNPESNRKIAEGLKNRKRIISDQVANMWDEVFTKVIETN